MAHNYFEFAMTDDLIAFECKWAYALRGRQSKNFIRLRLWDKKMNSIWD